MSSLTFARYEILRTLRNRRFFVFSLAFPVVLYFLIAGPQRHIRDFGGSGIPAPVYYMLGLVAFGTMGAMLGAGARIAAERSAGWNRQLRLSPLSPRTYFRIKLLTGYLVAGITIAVLYASGAALGVSISADRWVAMTGLVLLGLIPFAALGVLLGHLVTADSVGPAMGGMIAIFALIGGTWFPVQHGFLHDVGQFIPSYWLVRASHVAVGGTGWSGEGWAVIIGWSVIGGGLAAWAYRRDTARV